MSDLEKDFQSLTSASVNHEGSPGERVPLGTRRQRDLFCLGMLIDSLLPTNPAEASVYYDGKRDELSGENTKLVEVARSFVSNLQQAKQVDDVADHQYLLMQRGPMDSTTSAQPICGIGTGEDSRLTKEFQIYQWLGKGGFGDVYLARLDLG